MKEYIKNLSVGLAIVSGIAGLVLIIVNICQYFSQNYEFSAINAIILVLVVLVLQGASILGRIALKYINGRFNNGL